MTALLTALVIVLAIALVALAVLNFRSRLQRRPVSTPARGGERILFPFIGGALSRRALDAALRLANAEDATVVPIFLARVSLHLPLDAPLPRQSGLAIPLQEAIEHRATAFDVPVAARIERGRTYRHALRTAITHERYSRIVIAAAAHGHRALTPTTSPGSSTTPPAKSWCCARARKISSDLPLPAMEDARRYERGHAAAM